MRINPIGMSEYYEGNEVLRYGRDISTNSMYAVWYHDGIGGEPAWAMDVDILQRMHPQVDAIIVADAKHGLHLVDVDGFRDSRVYLDDREQCIARVEDEHVRALDVDPSEALRRHLWIESGNQVDEGYHKRNGEA